MKNLYKKTSAMLLTGTVMIGGFMVSGLNVHANSHTTAQERDIQRVKNCCKGYGDVCVTNTYDYGVYDFGMNNIKDIA